MGCDPIESMSYLGPTPLVASLSQRDNNREQS